MSEHNVELEREPRAVDDLLRRVDALREKRPAIHADVVHPGIAASITDPACEDCVEQNEALARDFESA